jgi:hypothetical protein
VLAKSQLCALCVSFSLLLYKPIDNPVNTVFNVLFSEVDEKTQSKVG